jgi:lipid-A-disaccharide synthase-like uncharacterized protein
LQVRGLSGKVIAAQSSAAGVASSGSRVGGAGRGADLSCTARHTTMTADHVWLGVGLLGQAFFSMRFLVQWIASERRRESVIPISFWFFSIGGGLALLIYATHRLDPVFMLGQGAGLLVYVRNLYLIRRKERRLGEAGRV